MYTCRMHCKRICVAFVCAYANTCVYLYVYVSSRKAVNTRIRHCVCTYVPRLVYILKTLRGTDAYLCLLGDLGHDDVFN